MRKSINQIRKELSEIQQAHAQVNSFFWGDFLRAYKENTELNYPLMGAFYPTAGFLKNQTTIQLTVFVCDKMYKDWSNLNDVESDTLQICRDIFQTINSSTRWQRIGRVQSCSVTKFIERGGDEVAGHTMTFQILLRDNSGVCGLPMFDYDFDQVTGAGCAPVQIYKDGILIETIEAGGIYEYNSDVIIGRSTATLMKTGQLISYRAGDDGDIEAGRGVDFFTLAENNPFGNTNRFTDELGGSTYANNIVIDWSTYNGTNVLGWYRLAMPIQGVYTWNQAIDNSLIFSIGTFTTGWKLPNTVEYFSLFNWGNAPFNKLNYAPFNLINDFWTSTTREGNTTDAYYVVNSTNMHFYVTGKAGGIKSLFNRTFTVTGTTLS